MKKMKTAVIVVALIATLLATISVASADTPTFSGVYEGTITINGNSAPHPDLTVLAQVRGGFVGSASVKTYSRGDVHGGLYVNGRFSDRDEITFYLRDFCGNDTKVSSTDPTKVYCDPDQGVHRVNLTFTGIPPECLVPPTPTPEPTTTPEATTTPTETPSNGDGDGVPSRGGGGGPRRGGGPTPTPTPTPEPTPTLGPEETPAPTPTPELTPTPTPTVPDGGIPYWIWVLIAAGFVGAGAAYWLHGKKGKGKK